MMTIRPSVAIIAIMVPTAAALFCIGYLGDKYADILSPAYAATCYQSVEYLQSYISAMLAFVGLVGVASAGMALIFRNINAFAYFGICGVFALIAGLVTVRAFAAGSC